MATEKFIARVQRYNTLADKLKAVQEYEKGGKTQAEIGAKYCVSAWTIGDWAKQHKRGMLGGTVSHTKTAFTETLQDSVNTKAKQLVEKAILDAIKNLKL
jgi:transposase-like protein